jgi:hypothetical protein
MYGTTFVTTGMLIGCYSWDENAERDGMPVKMGYQFQVQELGGTRRIKVLDSALFATGSALEGQVVQVAGDDILIATEKKARTEKIARSVSPFDVPKADQKKAN